MADEMGEHILEQGCRLSESLLWRLQREFYDQNGVSAWDSGIVPHYVTNNPRLAGAFCRILVGYLRDLCRAHDQRGPGQPPLLDPDQPLYVLEPGAGAGRFAYLFLQALARFRDAEPLRRLKICYVMADFTRSNLEFWAAHPQLRPFAEAGLVDFAVLDAEADGEIRLEHAGVVLGRQTLGNPLVVIGNYLFDTLTVDAFRVQDGRLLEGLVTVCSDQPEDLQGDRAEILARLRLRYEYREIGEDYYPSPDWNQILLDYRDLLGNTSLSIPVGGFRFLDHLLATSAGRLLVLASDKSWNRTEELSGLADPGLVLHGSFSLTVNFEALGRLFRLRGGTVLHSDARDSLLDYVLLLHDPAVGEPRETRLAFRDALCTFGPLDGFHLKVALEQQVPHPSLRVALELLRLSDWDPEVFYSLSPVLIEGIPDARPIMQREMVDGVERIWANYYHLASGRDVPFNLGRICHHLNRYQDSLRFYRLSLELFGQDCSTHFNMGLVHDSMGDLSSALQCFRMALDLDPNYAPARDWSLKIQARMGPGQPGG